MMTLWTSLRIAYPHAEDRIYDVKDCRHNIVGKAKYNGYDFIETEWNHPTKGKLLWICYEVTHWGTPVEQVNEASKSAQKKDMVDTHV